MKDFINDLTQSGTINSEGIENFRSALGDGARLEAYISNPLEFLRFLEALIATSESAAELVVDFFCDMQSFFQFLDNLLDARNEQDRDEAFNSDLSIVMGIIHGRNLEQRARILSSGKGVDSNVNRLVSFGCGDTIVSILRQATPEQQVRILFAPYARIALWKKGFGTKEFEDSEEFKEALEKLRRDSQAKRDNLSPEPS